ncbi:MAG: hypothetical protein AAF004_01820 [Pseudomonadota bacterium]
MSQIRSEEMPRKARGKRARFFEAEGVDELLTMVIELTSQVSALRERQYVTEKVLSQKGIDVSDAIEHYQWTDSDEQIMGVERERLLHAVLGNVTPPPAAGSDDATTRRSSVT